MFLSQGFFGAKSGAGGKATPGRDGITPSIGANGNWFIGSKDTGVKAKAETDSKAITHVALVDNTITFTHADGAKHAVQLPTASIPAGLKSELDSDRAGILAQAKDIQAIKDQYGQINSKITSLSGVYTYDGDGVPAWPNTPKSAYFVHLHDNAARRVDLTMPNPSGTILDGTTLVMSNGHNTANIVLSAMTGQTIEGQPSVTIAPGSHVMIVKNGSDWVKVMDVDHGGQTVPYVLTADKISKAMDHGTFTGSGSIKGLSDGWWFIPASNTAATGRPSGAPSDLVYFQQTLTPQSGSKHGIAMAFGKDATLKESMWVQYKISGTWTPWFKEEGQQDIAPITSSIDELKKANQGILDTLSQIQTAAGKIFAPTKDLFDAEANKLIDAKLAPYVLPTNQQVAQNSQDIQSLKSSAVTEPDIEAALKAKGWGPLTGRSGGGGDRPVVQLPKVWMMFDASIPSDLTSATTTTTGAATLRKIGTGNERLWVIVEKDVAAKVDKIQIGSSIASKWDTRDITIQGQKYTGFYSAGGFVDFNKKVTVEFGG